MAQPAYAGGSVGTAGEGSAGGSGGSEAGLCGGVCAAAVDSCSGNWERRSPAWCVDRWCCPGSTSVPTEVCAGTLLNCGSEPLGACREGSGVATGGVVRYLAIGQLEDL